MKIRHSWYCPKRPPAIPRVRASVCRVCTALAALVTLPGSTVFGKIKCNCPILRAYNLNQTRKTPVPVDKNSRWDSNGIIRAIKIFTDYWQMNQSVVCGFEPNLAHYAPQPNAARPSYEPSSGPSILVKSSPTQVNFHTSHDVSDVTALCVA